jgi:phage terminase large subunit
MGLPAYKNKELIDYMAECYEDPWLFAMSAFVFDGLKDAMGLPIKGPTEQQSQLLEGLAQEVQRGSAGRPHFSIRSGHGTGKSAALAQIIIWYLLTHENALIPCTAPSAHQLQDVLWKEIARWLARLKAPWKDRLELTTDRLRYKNPKQDGLGEAIARTARKENPDALQGFHAAEIMYVIDEAPGVPEEIYQTAEGALTTPGAISIMAGNPTRISGTFYRSHHEDRQDWNCLHWRSDRSPLVSKSFAEKMARKYGEQSFVYKIRVLGEFPTGNPDSLIPLELVAAAAERELDESVWKKSPVVFGVDPARFGDDETGFCIRQGRKVHETNGWGGLDTVQVAARVYMEAKKWKPAAIFVDSIGIGAGVADQLRKISDVQIIDVNVSERPSNVETYHNFRSEMWWKAREWFEKRDCSIPNDDTLMSELSTQEWKVSDNGKIRVESKAERKRRLGINDGGSPDRGDALVMTFTQDVSAGYQQASTSLTPEHFEDF